MNEDDKSFSSLDEAIKYIDEQPVKGLSFIWSIWQSADASSFMVVSTMSITPDRMFRLILQKRTCVKWRRNEGGVGVWHDEVNYINPIHQVLVEKITKS
jgi:hypothetical protein